MSSHPKTGQGYYYDPKIERRKNAAVLIGIGVLFVVGIFLTLTGLPQ